MRVSLLGAAVAAMALLAGKVACAQPARPVSEVCADCIRQTMQALTAPALNGRGCGTEDEHAAARMIAEKLAAYGVKGGAADGGYLQAARFFFPTYAAAPTLKAGDLVLTHGREILLLGTGSATGTLVVFRGGAMGDVRGKVVLLDGGGEAAFRAAATAGAAAVIAAPPASIVSRWTRMANEAAGALQIEGQAPVTVRAPIFARPEAIARLKGQAGQTVTLTAAFAPPQMRTTYNVIGLIPGATEDAEAVLLSAHYDAQGIRDGVVYPGANDDASGTAAVMEFARLFAAEPARKRAIQVILFGCEEEGGVGSEAYAANPATPLDRLVANLQFEMIGAPDPKRPKTLMLTGWERTTLGPALKDQGADIGPDLYPEQNFFQRSDNYRLAVRGVIAQTVSAWPLTPTYHRPTDTLANMDLGFMTQAVQSLVGPIAWLADGAFRPEWREGQKP